jgi:hypothetical protein
MLLNEMRNNIIPQITMLNDLRNELVHLNVSNSQDQQDLLNKLDALIAVVDQDKIPDMQQAFEQAYVNLNLPNKNDIENIMGLMNDSTTFVGEKIDGLGEVLTSINARNLENVLTAGRGEKATKKVEKAGKPIKEPIDDFINRAFTPETFNNDINRMDAFASACGISITADNGKPKNPKALASDIYKGAIKYFKIIRKHELSGATVFSDRDKALLEPRFNNLDDPDNQHELTIFYFELRDRLEELMVNRGASTLDNMKASIPQEPAAATASTPMIDPVEIKQEGNGLRKKQKPKKKVVKKQKVKRKTRYIV